MKKNIVFLILIIASFLFIRKMMYSQKKYKYRITSCVGKWDKVGITDSIGVYGDSIGWYNSNGTHVFFPKNSKVDTIKD
jgi:uncharacterized protein YxeA